MYKLNLFSLHAGIAGLISAALLGLAAMICCAVTIVISFKKKLFHGYHANQRAMGITAVATAAATAGVAPPPGGAPYPGAALPPGAVPPPPPVTLFTNQSAPKLQQFPDSAYPRQPPMAPPMAMPMPQPMPEIPGKNNQVTDPQHYQFQFGAGPVLHEYPPPSYDVAIEQPPYTLGQIPPTSVATTASHEKMDETSFN